MGQGGPSPYGDILAQTTRTRQGELSNQTSLLALQDLKAKQQAEQEFLLAIKNNPDLARQLLGDGSILGSLGQGPGASPGAPPGAITQSPLGGAPAQQIPAYPDASRYAGVSPQGGGPIPPDVMAQTMPTVTPPPGTPTLATIGPQGGMPGPPQGPPQGQQNPLLEMARRDPRAALMLQQQMQGQQDRQIKMQEQRLDMGVKVMEWLGRGSQGVKTQEDLDAFRQQAQEVSPQAAAQLPQFYTKEAMAPFIEKAVSVKDAMLLQVEENKAQAAILKARREQANIPNYTGDATLDAAIYARMQGQPADARPSMEIVDAARKDVQEGKITVSATQGSEQARQRSLGETAQKRLEAYDKTGMAGQDMHTVLDEAERLMGEGVYGNRLTDQATMAAYKRGLFQDDKKAQRTARLQELGSQLVLAHGSLGSGVSAKDAEIYAKAAGNFQQAKNLDEMKQSIKSMRTIGDTAIRNANAARESYEKTGKLPAFQERGNQGQGQPQGQPQGQGSLKPVGQMSPNEIAAEIAAIKARGGR